MTIKEGGNIVKRGGERMLDTLQLLWECTIWVLDVVFLPHPGDRAERTGESVRLSSASRATPSGSPLEDVGPVPDELRKDPFPGGTVPWCIQEAEKEQRRAREETIWKIAIAVSWSVTVVAALRALGML